MIDKVKVPKTTNRYGTRYGARNRNKVALVESQYKQMQKCPHRRKVAVVRLMSGVYECEKCHIKMTGRAYTVENSSKLVEETKEE